MKTKLSVKLKTNDGLNQDQLLQLLWKKHRSAVKAWFKIIYPDLNMNRYEGGIDSWFGFSSVMLFELGVVVTFKHEYDEVTITLS